MNDIETRAAPQERRSFKSTALIVLLVVLLGLLGWWYLLGGGGNVLANLFSDPDEVQVTSVPADPLPIPVQPSALIEARLERLETLALSLDAARREQQEMLVGLQGFVSAEDLQASSSRLRAEIRAVRASFPEAAELEWSQVTLAWHLLQLAEIEHRLFGNPQAVASLLERVGHLLGDHPAAMDLMVDLARLEEEIRESQAPGLLEVYEQLAIMGELAGGIPLRQSQYDPIPETSSGILDRVGAGLRSLVRIERLESGDTRDEVSRLQLVLGMERMQVALLRRDGAAFEQQRTSMVTWLKSHAQMDHRHPQELLARLANFEEIDFGVQEVDFNALLSRLGALVE